VLDLKNLDCLLVDTKNLLLTLTETAPFLRNYVLVGGSALTLQVVAAMKVNSLFF